MRGPSGRGRPPRAVKGNRWNSGPPQDPVDHGEAGPATALPLLSTRQGLPEFYSASLPACHGPGTPADLRTLAFPGDIVLPSVCVKTLGISNKLVSKLYQLFISVRVTPTAHRILCLRFARLVRRLPATPPRTQDSIRVGG